MILISEEKYKNERYPNYDYFKIDEFTEDLKKYYFCIYSEYMDLLYKYLLKNTDIAKYDKQFSNKKYEPVEEEIKDFYQLFADGYLEYYYIRNNLYLERLTKDETLFLEKKLLEDNSVFDKECEDFIKTTLNKVIFVDVTGKMETNYNVCYKSTDMRYAALNTALVLASAVESNRIEKDAFLRLEEQENINKELEEDVSKKLNMDVSVFSYGITNINKKIENMINK